MFIRFDKSQPPIASFDFSFLKKPFLASVLLITFLLGLQFFFFKPYFQLNDDTFKAFFAEGVGTNLIPSEYIGYSNCLWGFALKTFYTLLPGIAWYGLLILLIQAFSLLAFLYSLLLTPHSRFKTLLFLIAWVSFYFLFFSKIQYTATSCLAAQSGLFLAISLWRNRESDSCPWGSCLSGFLLFFSSLVRLEGFLITIITALPLLVFLFLNADKSDRLEFFRTKKVFLLVLSSMILFGAAFNYCWYEHDPGWREFNKFDKERVEFQDYRITEYTDQTKPFFDSVGWTQNDYRMFLHWYYMDTTIFSPEKISVLKAHFPRVGSKNKTISFESLSALLGSYGGQAFLMFFLTFLLFLPTEAFRLLLFQLVWLLSLLTFLIYYYRAPDHVFVPLFVLLLNTAIFFSTVDFKDFFIKKRKWLVLIGLFFLVIATASSLYVFDQFHQQNLHIRELEKGLDDSVHLLAPKDDQLYVVSCFPYETFNALDNFNIYKNFHLFELAVYQRGPDAKKMLDHFGIKDLFLNMVDNPNIFLICSPEEGSLYQTYMREKHHLDIYPELYFNNPYFRAYRIHSAKHPSLVK